MFRKNSKVVMHEMVEKDDFFGIHDATEKPLPRHMEAAVISQSRTAKKKYREASNKQNAVSDKRSAYFVSKFARTFFKLVV